MPHIFYVSHHLEFIYRAKLIRLSCIKFSLKVVSSIAIVLSLNFYLLCSFKSFSWVHPTHERKQISNGNKQFKTILLIHFAVIISTSVIAFAAFTDWSLSRIKKLVWKSENKI